MEARAERTSETVQALSEISRRSVVVLGSKNFKEAVIKRIEAQLVLRGFLPVVAFKIKEQPEEHFTPRQRLHWFLSNSKFVIAEDSVPYGEMIELEFCKNLGVTTAILHDERLPRSSWMTLDIDIHGADFKCFSYEKGTLERVLERAIGWAESRNKEKQRAFTQREQEWKTKNAVFSKPEVVAAFEQLKKAL